MSENKELKKEIIILRVTSSDKEKLKSYSKSNKMSLSTYLVQSGLMRNFNRDELIGGLTSKDLEILSNLSEYKLNFIRIKNLLKNKDSNFAKYIIKTMDNINRVLNKVKNDRKG